MKPSMWLAGYLMWISNYAAIILLVMFICVWCFMADLFRWLLRPRKQ